MCVSEPSSCVARVPKLWLEWSDHQKHLALQYLTYKKTEAREITRNVRTPKLRGEKLSRASWQRCSFWGPPEWHYAHQFQHEIPIFSFFFTSHHIPWFLFFFSVSIHFPRCSQHNVAPKFRRTATRPGAPARTPWALGSVIPKMPSMFFSMI